MARNVVAAMVAWFLSGPEYMPIMILGAITPTTRNVDWLICTVWPTGFASPKRSFASSSPRKMLRRFSAMSSSSMKRPPGCTNWLRISPKLGSTPRIRALTVLVPRGRPRRREYSRLTACRVGTRASSSSASSSRSCTLRPEGRPA